MLATHTYSWYILGMVYYSYTTIQPIWMVRPNDPGRGASLSLGRSKEAAAKEVHNICNLKRVWLEAKGQLYMLSGSEFCWLRSQDEGYDAEFLND